MRKFDLDEARKGAKLTTRCGIPVKVYEFDMIGTSFPILATIRIDKTDMIVTYRHDGQYRNKSGYTHDYDLMIEE